MSTRPTMDDTRIESPRIGPDDPRYPAVVDKRFNKRFRASADYVRLVSSTDQVVAAVEEAVREGRRLAVTRGGHCLEGFASLGYLKSMPYWVALALVFLGCTLVGAWDGSRAS